MESSDADAFKKQILTLTRRRKAEAEKKLGRVLTKEELKEILDKVVAELGSVETIKSESESEEDDEFEDDGFIVDDDAPAAAVEGGAKTYTCDITNKKFSSKAAYKEHLLRLAKHFEERADESAADGKIGAGNLRYKARILRMEASLLE